MQYLSRWFDVQYCGTRDADIIIKHPHYSRLDITVDVKSIVSFAMRRRGRRWCPVGKDDEVQLHTNYRQRCDYLLFARVHEDLGTVWFCGSILKADFLRDSRLHRAGDSREYRTHTKYHEDTRVLRIRELEDPSFPYIKDVYVIRKGSGGAGSGA